MSVVSDYVILLIVTALVTAFGEELAHQSQKSGVRALLGLLLLVAVVSPLPSVWEELTVGIGELFDAESRELDEGAFYQVTEEAFCQGVGLAIADKFGAEGESVSVSCHGFDPTEMRAEQITVRLTDGAVFLDLGEIKYYVMENFSGRCTVEVVI